jgi:hypothetical protein
MFGASCGNPRGGTYIDLAALRVWRLPTKSLSAAEALVGLVANSTAEFDSMEQLLGTFIPLADGLKILCYKRVAWHRGLSFES